MRLRLRTLSRSLFAPLAFAAACSTGEAPPPRAPEPTAATAPDAAPSPQLLAALGAPTRKPQERVRDAHRHPAETLAFLGLRDDMNVVEIDAGGGWYTAILAPFLREKGALAVTIGDPNGPADSEGATIGRRLTERLAQDPAAFGKVRTIIEPNQGDFSLGPDGSADAVLLFRNIHNWIAAGVTGPSLARVHRVLKPGGVLGIEAHRGAPGGPTDAKSIEKTGYVPEAEVVRLIEAAGFKLAARSEINANPKDTKDHPEGVWTLPPTFALKDQDRAKYEAIGETDRMTLRFVKP
jgi:predicted methyltransferase